MKGLVRIAVSAALCLLVGSCSDLWTSPVVNAPSGPWRDAYVEVEYEPSFSRGGRTYPPHVSHTLYLDSRRPYNRAQVTLVHETTRSVSEAQFERLRQTRYEVRFAPDAHALALSTDGGHAFMVFDLTTLHERTEHPFWCKHRLFRALDPWPDSRALALEVLAGADSGSRARRVHATDRAVWFDEFEGATRYACEHRDEPALRAALVEAFFRPDDSDSETALGYPCISDIARDDAALVARIRAALPGAQDPRLRGRLENTIRSVELPPPNHP